MRVLALPRLVACAASALLLIGCPTGENPACPNGECPTIDAPVDVAIACTPQMPCEANSSTPFCVEGTCVGCVDSAACETIGNGRDVCLKNPPGAMYGECVVCDEDDRQAADVGGATDDCQAVGLQVCDGGSHVCRECRIDGECTSGICAGGSCVAAGDVAYVVPSGGTDNPMCSSTMRCATLRQAAATTKPFILVAPGVYSDSRDVDLNSRNVTIRATGATFGQTNPNSEVLRVHGTSQVVIQGGTFDGTGDGSNPVIDQADAGSALTLDGVTVTNSSGPGVMTVSGRLVVRRSTITMNAGVGLSVDSVTHPFELTQSTISRNAGGGVRFSALSATVMNNFIIKNCGGNIVPALNVVVLTTPGASRLEFNTIAGNLADAQTNGGGVACAASTTAIRNSILFSNNGANQQFGCTVRYSTVQGATPDPPNGIIADAPNFLNTGADDFGLMPGSPVAAQADPGAPLTGPGAVDHAGEARPMPAGSRADLGADEIP